MKTREQIENGQTRRQIIVGHANTFHEPAIAIIEGDRVYAEAVERHTQCKQAHQIHGLWYSWRAIKSALKQLDMWPVENADITTLTTWDKSIFDRLTEKYGMPDPNQYPLTSILLYDLPLEPLFGNSLNWIFRGYPARIERVNENPSPELVQDNNTAWESKNVRHHLSHAALAAYTSPFDECIVMVIDGYGENTSKGLFHFSDNRFKELYDFQTSERDSLGFLYSTVTELCGFNSFEGEEWKIMGLAAYGKYDPDIYGFFKKNVTIDGLDVRIKVDEQNVVDDLAPLMGGIRRPGDRDVMKAADLAHNFQKWFEDTIIRLMQAAGGFGLSKNLAFAGGCALNSSANGKILKNTDFERLHIPCAPADDGNALGAALYEKYCVRGENRKPERMSPYLGTMIDIEKLEKILGFRGIKYRKVADVSDLCDQAADLIAQGNIIGWIQGRAEYGPRALGNRSILADPRSPDMKDQINARVKFREAYRPLAPSILPEFGPEYFEDYQESPYMERTLPFRKEVRDRVPAVVHKSGTGRLQTVNEQWNPRYYRLIRAFYEKTGIPMLLNTSFNVMGKPIMHSVEDAITVFFTTGLDYLIIGDYILLKN